jgi:hypothetical protein
MPLEHPSAVSPHALTAAVGAAVLSLHLAGEAMAASDPAMALRRIGELQVALVEAFAAASGLSAVLLGLPAAAFSAPTKAPAALH